MKVRLGLINGCIVQLSLDSLLHELVEEIIATVAVAALTILLSFGQRRWGILNWLWKRLFTKSITLNATAIIRNPEKTKMLLVYNPKHKMWLPPGGHVAIRKGETPHNLVMQRIKRETGYDTDVDNSQVRFDEFHDEERTMARHRELTITRIPQPRLALFEEQPRLPCHCKWHYDLFYLCTLDENENPRGNPQYDRRWCSRRQIHELGEGRNPQTYTNVMDLADEFLEDRQQTEGDEER